MPGHTPREQAKKKQVSKKMARVEDLRRKVTQAEANLGMARHGEGLSLTRPHSRTGRVEGPRRAATLTRLSERLAGLKKELKAAKTQAVRAKQKPKHV